MATVTTSQDSSDSLPLRGYTLDQLSKWIQRQLGEGVFVVELTKQQILDNCLLALGKYSEWRPRIKFGSVQLQQGKFDYLAGVDLGLGPVSVSFVQRLPTPQALFWGNLIDVAPLMSNGMGDYDMFLRWQKMWERITSVRPDWIYDEINKTLYIHNPIERFHCGVVAYVPYEKTEQLDQYGANWVRDYAFEKCRLRYGEIMNKFNGAIPGPIRDLQLDQQKRGDAKEEIQKLEDRLFAAQISTPLGID